MSLIPCASLPSSFARDLNHVSLNFGRLIKSLYSRRCPVLSSIIAPEQYSLYAHSSSCRCWLAAAYPLLGPFGLICSLGTSAVSLAASITIRWRSSFSLALSYLTHDSFASPQPIHRHRCTAWFALVLILIARDVVGIQARWDHYVVAAVRIFYFAVVVAVTNVCRLLCISIHILVVVVKYCSRTLRSFWQQTMQYLFRRCFAYFQVFN